METNFLKTLTTSQVTEVRDLQDQLKALANRLNGFLAQHGDNHGTVEQARSYTKAAVGELEELVARTKTRKR